MTKAKLVEILRDMGEEIPDDESAPKNKSPHGKVKYTCKECGGKGICEHNNRKPYCKISRGSQICEHNKRKAGCNVCQRVNILKKKQFVD